MDVKYEQCVKFISKRIQNYTKPEVLKMWVNEAVENVPDLKTVNQECKSFYQSVNTKLARIVASDGYSLAEQVQLAFIFSREVSKNFVKKLTDNGYKVKVNFKNRIIYVSSKDKLYCRSSDQGQNDLHFKGEPVSKRRYGEMKIVTGNGQATTPTTQNSQHGPTASLPPAQGQGSGQCLSKRAREPSPTKAVADSKRCKPASPTSSNAPSGNRSLSPPRTLPATHLSTDSENDPVMNQDDTIEIIPPRIPFWMLPVPSGMVKVTKTQQAVWRIATECKIDLREIDIVKYSNNLNGRELLTASECNNFIVNAIKAIRRVREPATSFCSNANFLPLVKLFCGFTELFIEPLHEKHGNILGDSLDYMDEQISDLGTRVYTNVVPRKEIRSILVTILELVTPKEFQAPVDIFVESP
ncbi:Protein CBG07662 [Caenorhabditis briggsae]|uniref:Protein CBG07662 n=1 Tax=Caenorhabditis briggsae TaxID=6238 RepID=A8X4C3_CAEBR|nr:Protein CBG07662 [Caenorhabditis briggsae]CAP27483.1 Protein CBG07662 [Caenorhabditis briggsae]